MDFRGALRARLIAAGVTGGKVFWNIVPQGTTLPYTRLQVVSDPRPEHLKGYDAMRQSRVQADHFAATYAAALAGAEATIAALAEPESGNGIRFGRTKAEGPRDLGEDIEGIGFVHRASVDLLVAHRAI